MVEYSSIQSLFPNRLTLHSNQPFIHSLKPPFNHPLAVFSLSLIAYPLFFLFAFTRSKHSRLDFCSLFGCQLPFLHAYPSIFLSYTLNTPFVYYLTTPTKRLSFLSVNDRRLLVVFVVRALYLECSLFNIF